MGHQLARPRMPKGLSCMRDTLTLWFVTLQTGEKGLSCTLFRCPHRLDVAISNVPSEFPLTCASQPPLYGILPREFVSGECLFGLNSVLLAPCVRLGMQLENRHFDHKQFKSPRVKEKKRQMRAKMKRCSGHPPTQKVAPPFRQPFLCCMCEQTGHALISVFNAEDQYSSKLVSNAFRATDAQLPRQRQGGSLKSWGHLSLYTAGREG